jgi:hypothetical protein
MIGRLIVVFSLLMPVCARAQVPQNLTATGGDEEVSLTWEQPTVEEEDALLCYRVYRDTTSIPDDNPEDQSEKRIAELDASGDGPFGYTDTNVANGTRYFYRVTAEVGEAEEGAVSCGGDEADESSFSNEATATPFVPVTLQVTEPGTPVSAPIEAGTPVDVVVSGTNVPEDETVRLRYRQGGEQAFETETMSLSGAEFSASISGDEVTTRGIDFAVTTQNERNETVRVPTDGVFSLRVAGETPSFTQPGGTAQTAYRMVSFPTQPDNPQLSNLFESLAPYDPTEWRLFAVNESGSTSSDGIYVERDDINAPLEPGRGIWLISRSNATVGAVQGVSVRTDRPYEIPLREGWNLIGTPFAFDVPMSQLRVENTAGTLQDVFGYDGTFVPKTDGDVLEPTRGYLVRLSDGQSGTLVVEPSSLESGASPSSTASVRTTWQVDVSAQIDRARDRFNTFGVSPGAGPGIDPEDGQEPPPIGNYVSLAFQAPTQDGKLWRDLRSDGRSLHTWTAEVQTNVSGLVTLRTTGVGAVPEDREVWLVDPALDLTQNLRERPRYQFSASGDETTRQLRFVVGEPEPVRQILGKEQPNPQRVELLPSVPNPVRTHATLRYQLPKSVKVTLALYDLLGRRVATLVDDQTVEAGTHAHTWTPGGGSRALSSGTYVLRLRAGDVTQTRRIAVVK